MRLLLFYISALLVFSNVANAQHWKQMLPANREKAKAVDLKKEKAIIDSAKKHEQFCKDEEARTIVAMALAATRNDRQKAMVPLAGQKSYFGGMNDYMMKPFTHEILKEKILKNTFIHS